MDEPILSIEERAAINSGRWFSTLSPSLRHDILRCAQVRRYHDGDLIVARGDEPQAWFACARGAMRISSISLTGKLTTLSYMKPGVWFGDVAIFDGKQCTHDVYAHGQTTALCVARADFQHILEQHTELYEALMRQQAQRVRQLFGLLEDLNTLPLRARLAKQLAYLANSYGVPSPNPSGSNCGEIRIGLQLAQEELAQLLGASRQRVNQELKSLERDQLIRVKQGGLIIRDRNALLNITSASTAAPCS